MKLALFDLDHTLLPLDSDHAWGEFTVTLGWADPAHFRARNDRYYADYKAGTLDIHDYMRFATEAVRRQGAQAAAAAHQRFMQEVIKPAIRPEARALIEQHRRAGDQLLLVTATNEFVTQPIAQALGFDELLAVQLARDADGWITGDIQGVPSFREGKVSRVQDWLAQRGLGWANLTHSVFYTDSINDLALLQQVAEPVATNPDDALRAQALARGWRILDLFAPATGAT